MKKFFAWLLIFAMVFAFAGCGKEKENPASIAPVETTQAPTQETSVEETTQVPEEVPTVMAKPLFGEILDGYFDGLLQGFTPEQFSQAGLNALVGEEADVSKIGYSMDDLDGDGNTELLIGPVGSTYVYAMYTLQNEQEVMLIDATARNTYQISSDGVFMNRGSSSASSVSYTLYIFQGGQLLAQDGLVCEEGSWYYENAGTREALDEASALAITAQLEENVVPIAYIPFSEYNS